MSEWIALRPNPLDLKGFFRCRDAGETLSRTKIRSSLILGVALQFGSITFAQDHKIEVTGDYSCIHADPQNNNLIPSFSLDRRGGSAVETHERREPAKVLALGSQDAVAGAIHATTAEEAPKSRRTCCVPHLRSRSPYDFVSPRSRVHQGR
jgi:hypothetical protein